MVLLSENYIFEVLKNNFMRGQNLEKCLEKITLELSDDGPYRTSIFWCYTEFQKIN